MIIHLPQVFVLCGCLFVPQVSLEAIGPPRKFCDNLRACDITSEVTHPATPSPPQLAAVMGSIGNFAEEFWVSCEYFWR